MTDCRRECPLSDVGASRRDFLASALVASVGAFLAACGDGVGGGTTGLGAPLVITLSNFSALAADGGIARVDGNSGTPIAVTRLSASSYRAFSMSCTHAGTTVNIVGGAFSCPNHGAQFAATGAVTRGPATTPLREYTVVFSASAGTITIT